MLPPVLGLCLKLVAIDKKNTKPPKNSSKFRSQIMASKHPNNLAMYPFFEQPLLMRRVHQLRAIGEAVSISGSPEGLVSPTVSRIPMALSMTPSRFQGLKVSKFQNLLLSPTSSRLAMNSIGLVLRPSRVLKWPRLGPYSIFICCTSVLRC